MVGHSRARFVNARQCNTLGFCFGVGRELQDTHQRHVGLRSHARRAGHRFLKSPSWWENPAKYLYFALQGHSGSRAVWTESLILVQVDSKTLGTPRSGTPATGFQSLIVSICGMMRSLQLIPSTGMGPARDLPREGSSLLQLRICTCFGFQDVFYIGLIQD